MAGNRLGAKNTSEAAISSKKEGVASKGGGQAFRGEADLAHGRAFFDARL